MDEATCQVGKKKVTIATEQDAFDKALAVLNKAGYIQTETKDLAQARIALGKQHDVSQYGSYNQEGFLYLPKDAKSILIVDGKHNPILKNPVEATNAHRNGKEFYVEADKLRQLAKSNPNDAIKSGVLLLSRNDIKNISVDKLAEHPLSNFLLRDTAKDYGKFLKDANISSVPIYVDDKDYTQKQDKPFARLLWLWNLGDNSGFDGFSWDLHDGSRVRGVRASTEGAKLTSQKSLVQRPTLTQILKTSRQYVPDASRKQFEADIQKLYQ